MRAFFDCSHEDEGRLLARRAMAAVGELCRQLLTKLKEIEVTSALCADVLLLSASDAAFLALAERAGPAFAEAWPEAQQLDAQAVAAPFLALAAEALRVDSRLQKRCDRLVPKRTTEASFWRCYSSALYALLLAPPAPASAAGEGAAEAAAGGVGAGGGGAGGDGASVTGGLKGDEASGAQHGGADGGDALGDELFFKPAKARRQNSGERHAVRGAQFGARDPFWGPISGPADPPPLRNAAGGSPASGALGPISDTRYPSPPLQYRRGPSSPPARSNAPPFSD